MTRIPQLALVALVALAALAPLGARAQSSPLIGDWAVEITAGMRIENEEATPGLPPRPPRPPGRCAAASTVGSAASVTQRSQATLNTNGTETTAAVLSTWALTAEGDAIRGTVAREIEGTMGSGMPAQPVTGTRIK